MQVRQQRTQDQNVTVFRRRNFDVARDERRATMYIGNGNFPSSSSTHQPLESSQLTMLGYAISAVQDIRKNNYGVRKRNFRHGLINKNKVFIYRGNKTFFQSNSTSHTLLESSQLTESGYAISKREDIRNKICSFQKGDFQYFLLS